MFLSKRVWSLCVQRETNCLCKSSPCWLCKCTYLKEKTTQFSSPIGHSFHLQMSRIFFPSSPKIERLALALDPHDTYLNNTFNHQI